MENELRSFWNRYFRLNWQFGLSLLLLICVPRFILVLKANETGSYSLIGLIMGISAFVPFIFLNKHGRKQIGLTPPKKLMFLALAFFSGLIFSIILYYLGEIFYGKSYENWYEYIGKSYSIPESISFQDKKIMFLIMAITGMSFSPIGEELFFRGIVHRSFEKSVGDKNASIIDSLSFALTHISHFGIVYINGYWNFYLIPALIWLVSMFTASVLFFYMKKRTSSLLGAILCHAGFNLGMIYCIFFWL